MAAMVGYHLTKLPTRADFVQEPPAVKSASFEPRDSLSSADDEYQAKLDAIWRGHSS